MIIDAVQIMTGRFDRNINYREKLSKGDGSDVPFLSTPEGIISITVPAITGARKVVKFVSVPNRQA